MFKTPDVFDQIADEVFPNIKLDKHNEEHYDMLDDIEACKEFARKFVRNCDEYIDIEFDTEKGTATVVSH